MAGPAPPVAIVCVGMAGSGKTTFMQRINSHLHSKKQPPYVMNLDPAVHSVPFEPNIDIRDSVDYKEVMKQYNLGPNGGILTSLNLFATKVDQILGLLEKRTTPDPEKPDARPIGNIIIDTPGQIEVFVWSASGAILLDALASAFPTVLAYVIDTPRTTSTSTFMSNMLYACSILYKTKLPMILVFNKTDVQDAEFAQEWMTDFEAFQAALRREEEGGSFGGFEGGDGGAPGGGSGYLGSLLNSMSLVLEEFYRHLRVVGVSSMTGQGVDDFFDAVKEKAAEYERDYRPELERRRKERQEKKESRRDEELGRLMKDMNVGSGSRKLGRGSTPKKPENGTGTLSDMEDDDDEDGPKDVNMMDPTDDDEDDEDDNEDDEGKEGLEGRYRRALADRGRNERSGGEGENMLKYLASGNVG